MMAPISVDFPDIEFLCTGLRRYQFEGQCRHHQQWRPFGMTAPWRCERRRYQWILREADLAGIVERRRCAGKFVPLTQRGVPDVAATRIRRPVTRVRVDGSASVIGGTSAVAPLWQR